MTAHGYARVSTADQNLDRQTDALAPLVDRLWCDRQSGKDMDRPRWRAMVSALRPGDVLYVASIDRMGRDYGDVCDAWASITALGVDIVVLDMPLLDTRESPGGGRHRAPHIGRRHPAPRLRGPAGAGEAPRAAGPGHRRRPGPGAPPRQARHRAARWVARGLRGRGLRAHHPQAGRGLPRGVPVDA